MEIPVIVTNWGGSQAFLTPENSYLLEIDGLVTIDEGAFRGHRWADVSKPELTSKMRACISNKTRNERLGIAGREMMLANFTNEAIAEQLVSFVDGLVSERFKAKRK